MRNRYFLGALFLTVLALGGCTEETVIPAESPVETNSAVSPEQRDALANGDVTYEEYQAGFQRFAACMDESGFPLVNVAESGRVLSFGVPEGAVLNGSEARCYEREFEQLDIGWQLENEDTSDTARWIAECVRENGMPPADTVAEMMEQLEALGIDPNQC